jgi:hypothetical protein
MLTVAKEAATMSSVQWDQEEHLCRRRRARLVVVPVSGESERVALDDIIERRVVFGNQDGSLIAGLYFLRDEDDVVYLGMTDLPIAVRLRGALANGKTWTRANWSRWSVSVERPPKDYLEARRREKDLIVECNPRYNVVGRPPRRQYVKGDGDERIGGDEKGQVDRSGQGG